MEKQTEQQIRALKSDMERAFSMLSAQNFLLQQLYSNWFMSNPDARKKVPGEYIGAARFKATAPSDDPSLMSLQAQTVQHLEHFFASVKQRVEETEWALSRQRDTK